MAMSDQSKKKMITASRLREARKMAGLTQGQVAKQMKLHRPTISEIEAGNRSVTVQELTTFAELYEVDVAWLAGEGADRLDPHDDRVQLAFRDLENLSKQDLDKLMRALAAIKQRRYGE
jgi:transcriptional regulator with XRE-family HTH domain